MALVGVVFLLFAYQFRNLEADFSPQDLHTTFEEQKAILDEFVDVYGNTENIALILIESDDVLQPDVLEYIHGLARHFEAEPYTDRVESITTWSYTQAVVDQETGDRGIDVDPAIEGDTVEPEEIATLLRAIENTPLIQGRLVSEDFGLTAIGLFLQEDYVKAEEVAPVIDAIVDHLEASSPPDGTRYILGGLPYIRVWVAQQFKADQVILVPLSLLVCLFILFVSFRWLPGVVFPAMAVIVSATLIVGSMAWVGESLNIINQVVPLLIIVIGISDSIHLVSRFREEMRHRGDSVVASQKTLQRMAVACFLTSLTTAVGFISLGISRTELVRRFGITAAVGVLFAYLVTVHLLPALLSWTKAKQKPEKKRKTGGWIENGLEFVIRAVLKRPWKVLVVSAVVFASAVYVASLVNVDSRLTETFREGDAVWESTNLLQNELDGVLPLEMSFSSDQYNRFIDPVVINAIHDLKLWVLDQPGVLSATAFSDFLHQARVVYNDDATLRDQPFESVGEIAQLASMLEGGNPSPIDPFVTLDRMQTRLNIKLADVGTNRTRELGQEIEARAAQIFQDIDEVSVVLTGNAHVASAGVTSLVNDMLGSLFMAFGIIFVLMTVLFRSPRMGLLSVPPNVIPLVLTMAYMTIAGINLNTATVVTFAISLGLAVDHTIHMLARFGEEIHPKAGKKWPKGAERHAATGKAIRLDDAVVAAARGTGRAIVVTTVTLCAGMLVLLLSSFVPVRQFATLLGITAMSCLLGNLVILPALLKVGWKPKGARTHAVD